MHGKRLRQLRHRGRRHGRNIWLNRAIRLARRMGYGPFRRRKR